MTARPISTMHITRGPIPDLLTSIKQPLGGTQIVEYESSSGKPDTRLPFVMQVVKSITVNDGRTNSPSHHRFRL